MAEVTSPSARQKRRYARQLLLPEIGDAGQLRLCATRLRIAGGADARAAAIATEYLQRAGIDIAAGDGDQAPGRDDAPAGEVALAGPAQVRALAGCAELEEAAATLAGAFAAVEAIKATLAIGRPGSLPAAFVLNAKASP
jgi:hypothetical protein